MDSETRYVQDGMTVDYTPSTACVAGQVVQLDDGRAGICVDAIAANQLGAARVKGIVEIKQKAEVINAGTVVGWDEDGDPYGGTSGTGAITQYLADADFIIGAVQETTAATDQTAKVNLNEKGESGPVTYVKKITSAQMKLLTSAQQTLVPAPGTGKVVDVISIMAVLDYGSNVLAEPSAPDDLEVVYSAAGGTSVADIIGDFVIGSADAIAQPQIKNIAGAAVTTMVNKAVVLDNTGADYTGNAGGDTVFYFYTTVKVHQLLLA